MVVAVTATDQLHWSLGDFPGVVSSKVIWGSMTLSSRSWCPGGEQEGVCHGRCQQTVPLIILTYQNSRLKCDDSHFLNQVTTNFVLWHVQKLQQLFHHKRNQVKLYFHWIWNLDDRSVVVILVHSNTYASLCKEKLHMIDTRNWSSLCLQMF